MNKKTVLILEDNQISRTFLVNFFSNANYDIIESGDAEVIAEEILSGALKYDVLISDCCSKEGVSYSDNPAIMASKKLHPKIPRIGISCWALIDARDVHVHLAKPFKMQSLVEVLDNLLLR